MKEFINFFNDPASPLGAVDMLWVLYLCYGLIRGMFRGLPKELAGMLGTLTTLYCSWRFYGPVSSTIRDTTRVESEIASELLAYGLLVLTLLISWKVITLLLRKTLDLTCPEQLQRWGGGLLGLSKATLIVCVILTAVNLSGYDPLRDELIQNSWFGRTTQRVIPVALHETLPGVFPEPIDQDVDANPDEPNGSGNA